MSGQTDDTLTPEANAALDHVADCGAAAVNDLMEACRTMLAAHADEPTRARMAAICAATAGEIYGRAVIVCRAMGLEQDEHNRMLGMLGGAFFAGRNDAIENAGRVTAQPVGVLQ